MNMRGMMRCAVLACGLLMVCGAAARAQDFEVVPGARIGKVELGMSRQTVHRRLGVPDGKYAMTGGLTGEYWAATTGNDVRVVYRAGKVIQVKVTSQSFKTAEGLTTASSLALVQRHHRNLRKTSHFVKGSGGGLIDYYDDVARGIAFEFTRPASEETDFKPYAIVVHLPGRRVIPENDEDPARR